MTPHEPSKTPLLDRARAANAEHKRGTTDRARPTMTGRALPPDPAAGRDAKFPFARLAMLIAAGGLLAWIIHWVQNRPPEPIGEAAAFTMCEQAVKSHLRDPDGAEIPFVRARGAPAEHYFAWGSSTQHIRARNGFGLEVPVSGSCIVSVGLERIVHLSLNAKDMPIPNIRRPF